MHIPFSFIIWTNYIASYKPGRKLIFRKLYYHEANSLIKSKILQNEQENPVLNSQKPAEIPIEEEEIKENVLDT